MNVALLCLSSSTLWPGAPSARRGARRGGGGSQAAAGRAGPGAPRGEGGRRARRPGAGHPAGGRTPCPRHRGPHCTVGGAASGPGIVSWRGRVCRRLLTREQPTTDMAETNSKRVAAEDMYYARAWTSHFFALLECSNAACACARAQMLRSRSATRGCSLSRRLRRAAPRLCALRPTGPRPMRTPCWCRRRSRACSGGPGQRPPRRRAPLDATGRRPCGCPPSAGSAPAARRPRPSPVLGAQGCQHTASAARASGRQALQTPRPALLGAHRPPRRRRSMAVWARCGQGYRLRANLPQRAQAARPSG